METAKLRLLKLKVILIFPLVFLIACLMFFWTAGTFDYWQGWLFIATLLIPALFLAIYFLKFNPEFIDKRMRFREKITEQKYYINIAQLLFFVGMLVPGLDFRYGWSQVPFWLIIICDIIIFLSYLFVFYTFRENVYASRIIEIQKDHKVISSGPYSLIRHPMYSGIIPMYLAIPLALGSYYALIFIIPVIVVIVFRLLHEEKFLQKELPGYQEYMHKVKYRLIPGIW